MRVLRWAAGAVLLALAGAANASGVDCDALRGTDVPYQITYTNVPASDGELRAATVEQHYRRRDGTGRRLVRTIGEMQLTTIDTRHSFATRVRSWASGREVDMVLVIEGLPLDRDHFANAQDFAYVRRVRQSTGRQSRDENRARFRGEQAMTVSGCTFRVLVWDIERRNLEPRPGEPVEALESFWYAPELRSFLRFQARIASGPLTVDRTAARIETRFDPFE